MLHSNKKNQKTNDHKNIEQFMEIFQFVVAAVVV